MRSLVLSLLCVTAAFASDIESRVKHGYADSNGVKIHYASLGPSSGDAPLIVMIHGFPDYWYTWRNQMEALSDKFQCVAIDQRGYNLSDKPKGVENYDMKFLVGDVAAVIKSLGKDKAIIVGHDWGGAVAWQFALNLPQMTDRLIILNLPHPRGLAHALATNPEQQKNSAYARGFQQADAASKLSPEMLVGILRIQDPDVKAKYLEAFRRSDIEAMLNYYKRNYPREPYTEDPSAPVVKTQMSVLMFHGLGDTALLSGALNNTWDWMGKDLTLVTIPGAGHFVQTDPVSADLVSRSMRAWLLR